MSATAAPIPEIETARLHLRGHRRDDYPACVAMWADPVVTKFTLGKPSTPQQTWMRVLAYRGHWDLMNFGYWAIEDRATGAFLGEAGFADFHRDLAPELAGIPELGWAFAAEAHGRGLATEAVRAALAWADVALPARRTFCLIRDDHAASIRIAEKCGYHRFRQTTFGGAPTSLFDRTAAAT